MWVSAVAFRITGRVAAAFLLGLIISFLAPPSPCGAESLTYLGQPFPVAEFAKVPPDQAKISLNGTTFMVAERDAGKAVALAYARSVKLARSLPWGTYVRFLGQIRVAQDRDILEAVAKTLLTAGDLSSEEREDLIEAVRREDAKGGLLLDAIVSSGPSLLPAPVCMVIRSVGVEAQSILKEKAPEVLNRHDNTCFKFFNNVGLKALSEGRIDQAERDLNLSLSFSTYGHEADKAVLVARNSLVDLQAALNDQDMLMYQLAFEKASAQPFLAEAFKQGVPALIQNAAEKFVASGNPAALLRLVSTLPLDRRTDATHKVVGKAVTMLRAKDYQVLEDQRVQQFLIELAAKDESLRDQLSRVLDSIVTTSLSARHWEHVSKTFDFLTKVRVDPCQANDDHRFAWAEALLSAGKSESVMAVLSGARSRTPFFLWARIFVRNYPLLVLAVLIADILFAIRAGRKLRIARAAKKLGVEYDIFNPENDLRSDEGDDEETGHRFVRYSNSLRGGGVRDEYEELLALFGISPGVELKGIKNAYRNAVKTCHPDLVKNTTALEADRFIQLTQAYDRLLQLHEKKTGET